VPDGIRGSGPECGPPASSRTSPGPEYMGDSLTGGLLVALIAYKRSVSDQLYTP
jgi:hypothetical protein